ncbi:uncharacterized protein [Narcine bancroftii]|uniref:uncharacterized protein isoform X2 n=1 Tax=Narcine bancroftii TaxID=1343680 RepID=UPI0038316CC8
MVQFTLNQLDIASFSAKMSKSQNVFSNAKTVPFQCTNVILSTPERSYIAETELEELNQIPYGTIHLGKDQKIKQYFEPCQSIELQGVRLQSQHDASNDLPFSEAAQQNQLSSNVKPIGPPKTAQGLSSKDLDKEQSYRKDKLTLDSLPKILKQIKKKRASLKHSKGDRSPQLSHSRTLCHDGIGGKDSSEINSESHDIVRKPLVNYEYDLSSGELSAGSEQEGKSDEAFHRKERHFSESPHHLSKFDSDLESDCEMVKELPFPCVELRSVLEKKRRTPILQNIKDFLGYLPLLLPHCCSLCDKIINTLQDWNQHINEPLHKLRCLLLQRVYPDWVPGELPVTKKDPVEEEENVTTMFLKKLKTKRHADNPMPSKQENLKEPHSGIVVLGNLPSSGFSDFETVRLGSTFGKVLEYLKVGEKAFLKMDSEMTCNNIIQHFKKKPLFYGRFLTADTSSAQIQPLLKKPSAKIEKMLNKLNQEDVSTKERFLSPILKDKPDNLKKHPTSERERKSSESSEKGVLKSSDKSSEAAEWKSVGDKERIQLRSSERVHRRTHEIMECQRPVRRLHRDDCERLVRRISLGRSEGRESRISHESGRCRGSIDREEWRSSSECGELSFSDEIGEWRTSSDSGEQRDSPESRVQGGGSERAMWSGLSERVQAAWEVSSERGECGGGSDRAEWRSDRERGEWGESSERGDWRCRSERGAWGSSSERGDWGCRSEKDAWGSSSERGGSSERGETRGASEREDWESDSESGVGEGSESKEREWENDESRENAQWGNYESYFLKDIRNNDVEMKSETIREKTKIPFLESDSELEDLMEQYKSEGDEADVEDTQYETKNAIGRTQTQDGAEINQQELLSLKTNAKEPKHVVYVGGLVRNRCTKGDLIHLAKNFGRINNILLMKRTGQGFVEMRNSADAQAMVSFYKAQRPVLRGKIIRVNLCTKYKKLFLKFPAAKSTHCIKSHFGVPQHRQFCAPEEGVLAPPSTSTLAELRAKYSAQLLSWASVPLEGNISMKYKKWNPQTYEGKELDCFRFLKYAFKVPMLETHEQYLQNMTGTPDMYQLDTPKIDDAFIQLLLDKKILNSPDDLDMQLGESEKMLCKAQSKVAEIVVPLMLAIQKYELDELSGELDSLTTEQLLERLQSTIISCHQSIVRAGQTHCWLTGLRADNLLQLFSFGKTSIKPQDYPNMTSSDLLDAELVEQLQKKGKILTLVTNLSQVRKKPKKKKVFQKQQRWQQPYYRNPNPFRGRGRSIRVHPLS